MEWHHASYLNGDRSRLELWLPKVSCCDVVVCLFVQGSLNYLLGGIKQCKSMVILWDFPYNNALFRLVVHHDPCVTGRNCSWEDRIPAFLTPEQ